MTTLCPTVTTGAEFVVRTLAHLDCQAQSIGSFGYRALADPGAPAAIVITGLMALFVALYGIRLLFGGGRDARDIVMAVLKLGIVLTLVGSWPAFWTVIYDTTLRGPAELAADMTPASLPNSGDNFSQRLQAIDDAIASLTASGTGRQTGSLDLESRSDSAFRAIALEDESGFGWSRTIWLGSTIGGLAVVRIGGALLLALTPLFAGLLLFELTRGLFAGWMRGLVVIALGSLGLSILLAVEAAILEPWLADALDRRSLGYAIPNAPTELLALTVAFAFASLGLLFLLTKVAFQNSWTVVQQFARDLGAVTSNTRTARVSLAHTNTYSEHSRALAISESVMSVVRHEERQQASAGPRQIAMIDRHRSEPASAVSPQRTGTAQPLGTNYRRTSQRPTAASGRRDRQS